jgi:hypothetical protein
MLHLLKVIRIQKYGKYMPSLCQADRGDVCVKVNSSPNFLGVPDPYFYFPKSFPGRNQVKYVFWWEETRIS